MEQPGKKQGRAVVDACPQCGVARTRWPGEGVERQGTLYCCHGCAEGTGCTCTHAVPHPERDDTAPPAHPDPGASGPAH